MTNTGSATVTDANGNQVSTDGNGNFTDTTGKVVLTVAGNTSSSQTFTYTDTTGTSRVVTVSYKTYTVQTNFGCSGVGEYGPTSTSLVDTIGLPDGQSVYHFSYEATPGVSGAVTGRPASVTLPGGGVIGYAYTGGSNGIVCADGSVAGLTRTMQSDSPNTSWTYTRTPSTSSSHTEVVDGLNNHLNYDFMTATVPSGAQQPGAFYYEVNRNAWNGAKSARAIVAKATCYNGSAFPCTTTAIALPVAQLDTSQSPNGGELTGSTVKYNAYGGQTEIDGYDYGASGNHGLLLSKESFGYGACGPANLVSSDVVTDGGGNTVSNKTYCYDQTTVTATSSVPSHVAAPGARGNLTTATTYTGGVNLVTTSTYTDTGSVINSTDSINGATSFSYESTYTYATGATLPTPSSGVAMTVAAGFDTANTGLPTSSTDVNSQKTQYKTYDALLRPTEIDNADGGKTTLTYTPTQVSTWVYQSAIVHSDLETQLDGYGRTSRTALSNGSNWYQQDTCYDGNGNVAFNSYPYQGPGFSQAKVCSGAGESYTYDALQRVLKITHGDGSSIQNTYQGRSTQVMDENGVIRITQVDGLGRPAQVCEVFSTATTLADGATPVNCALDMGGSGVLTTYSYTPVSGNPATTVTQGAQTRIFQTDLVGRPLSTTEPERGVTTYAYTSNATGAKVTRTRPQANQTNPSTTTTTTTQYDTLSRPVSITYSDGTPTRTYIYDQTNAFGNGASLGFSKGRLTRHMVSTGNGMGQAFGYDAMGRVVHLETCRWSTCGHSSDQSNYTYDWAGDLLTSTNPSGNPGTITYGWTVAGELTSMTSSVQSSTLPGTILSNIVNGPNGPISYSYGNSLSQYSTYDGMGRLQGGWVCTQAPSFGCSNGQQQLYGFFKAQLGSQVSGFGDNTGLNAAFGYDEFNRLKSTIYSTNYNNAQQTFSYLYDRYGNRWQQNAPQGGPAPGFTFNLGNNQIGGMGYDAAGNQTSDGPLSQGYNTYQYDAEGNQISVDSGQTAQYFYDALNHRVRILTAGNSAQQEPPNQEIDYDINGKRLSIWDGSSGNIQKVQLYWGSKPVAYYTPGAIHFQHQDWLGSARLTTSYNGATESTLGHYPFGEVKSSSGNLTDAYQFGQLDHTDANTEHAQFREYENGEGHWLAPDPYDGSYDATNPQSFNRYAYVLNNPMGFNDPSGQRQVRVDPNDDGGGGGLFTYGHGYSGTSSFGAGWDPFQTFVTVSSPDGDGNAHSYTDSSWNATASSDTGNTVVGSGIYSNADGEIGGVAISSTFWGLLSNGFTFNSISQFRAPNNGIAANPTGCKVINGKSVCPSQLDDYYNVMEVFKHNYRDSKATCSTHATVTYFTGTTSSHTDAFNPQFDLLNHIKHDAIPDFIYNLFGKYYLPGGRASCPQN